MFIHACITKFTGRSNKAVLPEELKFPEGATLDIKPTESPTSHEQPAEVKTGIGHKDDHEEEAKGD